MASDDQPIGLQALSELMALRRRPGIEDSVLKILHG